MNRYTKVRELVKDPSLRVTEIAWKTGYNKGHVSRLRKEFLRQELCKREWVGLTAPEVQECYDLNPARFASRIEAKLKEKNHG